MSILEEAGASVEAARGSGLIGDEDRAAVAALLMLAEQLDQLVDGLTPDGKLDNVSAPTFLKYLDALGLTPAARRQRADKGGEAQGEDPSSGLAAVRKMAGRKAS